MKNIIKFCSCGKPILTTQQLEIYDTIKKTKGISSIKIAKKLKISQALVGYYLKLLRYANLIEGNFYGKDKLVYKAVN